MPPTIPTEEMRAELDAVLKAVSLLTAVCTNLQAFLDGYQGRLKSVLEDDLEMYQEMLRGREAVKAELQTLIDATATNPQPETK